MEGFSNLSVRTNLKLSMSRKTFKEEKQKRKQSCKENNVGFKNNVRSKPGEYP